MTGDARYSRLWLIAFALAVTMSACGGDEDEVTDATINPAESADSDGAGTPDEGSDGSGGSIDGAPPSGQATASVDGLELTFDLPGLATCVVSDESLTYSYRIGDNEMTLGGGLNQADGGWIGSIALTIFNPDGELGPIAYYPAPGENGVLDGSLFTIDGNSVRYEGPMLKQPANDGSQPPPVEVGTGTIVATC